MKLPSDTMPVQLLLGNGYVGLDCKPPNLFRPARHFLCRWLPAKVDAAVNYPINKNPDDFRAAEHILLDWVRTHGIRDLKITMKLGSLNNLRSPEHNLSKSFLLLNLDYD